jgi:hypothetical protein
MPFNNIIICFCMEQSHSIMADISELFSLVFVFSRGCGTRHITFDACTATSVHDFL